MLQGDLIQGRYGSDLTKITPARNGLDSRVGPWKDLAVSTPMFKPGETKIPSLHNDPEKQRPPAPILTLGICLRAPEGEAQRCADLPQALRA